MKPSPIFLKLFLIFILFLPTLFFTNAQTLIRGPYLQSGTPTSIIIHWRTNIASDARVRLGSGYTAGGLYTTIIDDASLSTEHIVKISGLAADTKYFYSIGTSTVVLQCGVDNFFTTSPSAIPGRKLRFVAFGDCGNNGATGATYQTQTLAQYQNYLTTNGIDAADALLILGDNAYNNGTDAQYTTGFFNVFGGSVLKNHKLFPVPGNHDYDNNTTNQDSHSVPYYSIFDIPKLGEAGGVASNKEEFYSYDIGNVHFLALDAYGEESNARLYDTLGAQVMWIKNDLAANAFSGKWIIAYWHHPPYTKGSHDSDTETELISMRENFIRILERYGVDMIINGHSHDYERSKLMKGYFKVNAGNPQVNEINFSNSYNVSLSSAKYADASSCPYVTDPFASNKGTIYVVAGSTGASGGIQAGYPHDALPFSVNDGGMFYFEVDDNRLDAKMLRRNGTVFDNFTIMRGVNKTTNYTVVVNTPVTLTSSWPGNYTWNTTAATRSIVVTPTVPGTTNYTVTDDFGCVTDNFSITASSVLPLSKLDFSVRIAGSKIDLNWNTLTEINTKDFIIERSANGTSFIKVGIINASGNSTERRNYSYVDETPLPGVSYYRLVLINTDEHKEYFDIKKIIYDIDKHFMVKSIAKQNNLSLQISTSGRDVFSIRIVDVAGREYGSKTMSVSSGQVVESFSVLPGIYVWEVKNSSGESISGKAIVQ